MEKTWKKILKNTYVWPKWHETRRLGLYWRGKRARDASDASQALSHLRPCRPPPYPPLPCSLSPPSSSVWDASRWWCTRPCLDGGGCDVVVWCVVLVKITINRKNRKKKTYRGPKRHIDDASLGPWGSDSGPKRRINDASLGTFFCVVRRGGGSGGGGHSFAVWLWLWLTYM